MKLTKEMIMSRKPCATEQRVQGFLDCFPRGVVTLGGVRKAIRSGYDLTSIAQNLLPPTRWEEYKAAIATLWEEYDTKKAPLWAKYRAKRDLLWAAKYRANTVPLWEEYRAKVTPIWEKYRAKEAAVFYQAFSD